MSRAKLAAVICITAVLAFAAGAASLAGWTAFRTGAPDAVAAQATTVVPSENQDQLKRAMTFTAPAEPAK